MSTSEVLEETFQRHIRPILDARDRLKTQAEELEQELLLERKRGDDNFDAFEKIQAERDSLKAKVVELEAKLAESIPTKSSNTALSLERAHWGHELKLAVLAEREACARVAESIAARPGMTAPNGPLLWVANAIRARGGQ